MKKAIIGKKIGMTQIFDENGKVVPVTVVEAGPCVVVQKKTIEKDGYEAIQVGTIAFFLSLSYEDPQTFPAHRLL